MVAMVPPEPERILVTVAHAQMSDLGPLWARAQGATTEEEVSMMRDEKHPHQCPYCDLRFRYASEIRDHALHDPKEHAEAFLYVETHELP